VLPGVSGSFLLLTVGMYAPTLAAVNERDIVYLGVFILGAMVGLGLFVSVLQWLLENRRRVMLALMTGLMLGSLRALWPWQDGSGVQAPGSDAGPALALVLLGMAIVGGVLVIEATAPRVLTSQRAVVSCAPSCRSIGTVPATTTSPVCAVVTVSISTIPTSSAATGLCRTPFGTT
jgi:hypothetical protein